MHLRARSIVSECCGNTRDALCHLAGGELGGVDAMSDKRTEAVSGGKKAAMKDKPFVPTAQH